MNTSVLVSSLVLTALLPISVLALYAMLRTHLPLSPTSAMDIATAGRFDSEAERSAFHADLRTAQQARLAAVLARYRQIMEEELAAIDPRRAETYRKALKASADVLLHAGPTQPGNESALARPALPDLQAEPPTGGQPQTVKRISLWRAQRAARQGNGPAPAA